jgi:hypothetical protein
MTSPENATRQRNMPWNGGSPEAHVVTQTFVYNPNPPQLFNNIQRIARRDHEMEVRHAPYAQRRLRRLELAVARYR